MPSPRLVLWVAAAIHTLCATPALAQPTHAEPTAQKEAVTPRDKPSNDDDDDDDQSPSVGAEADVSTRFVWRGIALSKGAVAQPSAWGSAFGFTASVWASGTLTDESPRGRVSDVVPSLSYTYENRWLELEPGIIGYISPNGEAPASSEASVEAAIKLPASFRIETKHYIDVASHAGAYYGTLGPAYEHEFGDLTLHVGAGVGWASAAFNHAYFAVDEGALNLAQAGASLRYDLTDVLYVAAHADASTLLAQHLRDAVSEPSLFTAGLTLGFEL